MTNRQIIVAGAMGLLVLAVAVFAVWKPWGPYFGPALTVVKGDAQDAAREANLVGGVCYNTSGPGSHLSMEPQIHPGDFLIGVATPFADLTAGEVVCRTGIPGAGLVTHRLKSRRDAEAWITEGDANLGPDVPMTRTRYVCQITEVFRP